MGKLSYPQKASLDGRNLIAERWREKERAGIARWLPNVGPIIATLAFVLSVTTAFVSIWSARVKDLHDRQVQLSLTVNRIQELILKEAEIALADQQRPGPVLGTRVGPLIGSQVVAQVRRAYELAESLGTDAPSSELGTIAGFIGGQGDHRAARRLLQIAVRAARTPLDEIASLDQLAYVTYRFANSSEARKEAEDLFRKSLAIRYSGEDRPSPGRVFSMAQTELMWADAAASINCEEAKLHFSNGVQHLLSIQERQRVPPEDRLRQTAKQRVSMGFPLAQTCKPDPVLALDETPPTGPSPVFPNR